MERQYDVFRPSALPSASLGRRLRPVAAKSGLDAAASTTRTPDGELDRASDAWNARIDKEVKAVAEGLGELVKLADISPAPNTDADSVPPLHLKLKTAALIRATQTLRDTAHELRLALLLGADDVAAARRDAEAAALRREADALRRAVAAEFAGLRGGPDAPYAGGAGAEAAVSGVDGDNAAAAAAAAPDASMDVDDDDDDFEEVA
ncbi:hypothetical protein VHUM_02798 [Vanrija humicola]|uniref:Uncharacterized protein n=1 Tax=Vanrija humicola TaxID=5417 RepID=A0A7D8UYP0_VANHU|nr:hypothetical protein VHUM_02798 [Vanrija humicola]